jgi:Protein of unknown function (DUF2809)
MLNDISQMNGRRHFRYRLALLLSAIASVILGYAMRFHGPGPEWFNDGFGSVAYEIFWIVLVLFCFPKVPPLWGAIGVLVATCALEVLQLWKAPFLASMRATLPGRLILGTTFNWGDFPAYSVGCSFGYGWTVWLNRFCKPGYFQGTRNIN